MSRIGESAALFLLGEFRAGFDLISPRGAPASADRLPRRVAQCTKSMREIGHDVAT